MTKVTHRPESLVLGLVHGALRALVKNSRLSSTLSPSPLPWGLP